jgi:hypothetical protein
MRVENIQTTDLQRTTKRLPIVAAVNPLRLMALLLKFSSLPNQGIVSDIKCHSLMNSFIARDFWGTEFEQKRDISAMNGP